MAEKIRRRKTPKELLKSKDLSRKEYTQQLALLKKQGIVSKNIDARSHKPTRYMLNKIQKFKDVAVGHALAVPAKKVRPDVAEGYTKKGVIEKRDKFFIVPKTVTTQRADVVRGHVAIYEPLRNGQHRRIVLPYRAKDMNELVEILRDHEHEINQMKEPTEQFGFQVWGNNSLDGFPHADMLADYIQNNYHHILSSPRFSRDAMRGLNFVLLRFKNRKGYPVIGPYMGERITHIKPSRKRNESAFEAGVRRKYAAGRKEKQRAKETKAQREKRLAYQREYYHRTKPKKK